MTDPNELCSLTRAILLVNADCATAWNTRCVYMCINMFNHAWHALHLYKKKLFLSIENNIKYFFFRLATEL